MRRRDFVKALPLTPLLPAVLSAQASEAQTGSGNQAAGQASSAGSQAAGSQKQEVPAYAGKLQHSDGTITDADGNAQPGFAHTSSDSQQADPKAPYQMPLTQEEQDIMDGKKGPELAKVMEIVVAHGNAFGAP